MAISRLGLELVTAIQGQQNYQMTMPLLAITSEASREFACVAAEKFAYVPVICINE
jgi:hypothetical protein